MTMKIFYQHITSIKCSKQTFSFFLFSYCPFSRKDLETRFNQSNPLVQEKMGREEGGEGYFLPRLTLSYPAKNVCKMDHTKNLVQIHYDRRLLST